MKSNFDTALKYVLIDEGGNVDDPHDHGGRTSRGITQRNYDAWCRNNGKQTSDVWYAPDEDVKRVYKDQYWDPYCDDMPSGLDYLFFDISVNCGRTQAVKQFQRALGVKIDGMYGQVTRAAVHNALGPITVSKISDARRRFYKSLRQFPRYGRGWLNRVNHAEENAMKMVSDKPISGMTGGPGAIKADDRDIARTAISPETSGTIAAGSGSLTGILQSLQHSLEPYKATIAFVSYILIGAAVASAAYMIWGFYKRKKAEEAVY